MKLNYELSKHFYMDYLLLQRVKDPFTMEKSDEHHLYQMIDLAGPREHPHPGWLMSVPRTQTACQAICKA